MNYVTVNLNKKVSYMPYKIYYDILPCETIKNLNIEWFMKRWQTTCSTRNVIISKPSKIFSSKLHKRFLKTVAKSCDKVDFFL